MSSSDESAPSDGLSIEELADDFADRCRRGERPSIEEYAERYPEQADRIRRLFPMMLIMEDHQPTPEPSGVQAPAGLQQLGDFSIVREIGRGGMGIVYEAEQKSLGRRVALKVLPTHAVLTPNHVQRFEREARAAARLHHTNIVPVFGVGEHDGLHYYVMQYIAGVGLDEVLQQLRTLSGHDEDQVSLDSSESSQISAIDIARGLVSGSKSSIRSDSGSGSGSGSGTMADGEDRLAAEVTPHKTDVSAASESRTQTYWKNVAHVGIQIADAVEYAHSQGVMHRDIKPSNILLDAEGMAWVTDFGLAKDSQNVNLTRTGDIIGTLRYMAPERLSGKSDARSEVYAIGLTLYELLTMSPAYDQLDRERLIESLVNLDPPRPRKRNRDIPRDLETIVMKAISREPRKRYATASELSHDLVCFIEGRPIHARRVSPIERVTKWVRRRPAIATLSAAVILISVVGSWAFAWQWRERALAEVESIEKGKREAQAQTAAKIADGLRADADQQRIRADSQRIRAESLLGRAELAEKLNRRLAYVADMRLAQNAWLADDVDETMRILDRYLPQADAPDERGPEWHYLMRQCHPELLSIQTNARDLQCAHFSADGSEIIFSPVSRAIVIYDSRTGKKKRTWPGSGGAVTLAVSPAGDLTAERSVRGILVREYPSGEILHSIPVKQSYFLYIPTCFDNTGRYLAWGSENKVHVIELRSGKSVADVTLDEKENIYSISFPGNSILIGNERGEVKQLKLGSDATTIHSGRGEIVSVTGDRSRFVAFCSIEQATVLDLLRKRTVVTEKMTARDQRQTQASLCFFGSTRVAVADGPVVKVWTRLWSDPELKVYRGHRGDVLSIDYDYATKRMLTSSRDGTLKVWDSTREPAGIRPFYSDPMGLPLDVSSDGKRVVLSEWSTAAGRRVHTSKIALIDADEQKLLFRLNGHDQEVTAASLSPDGKQLVSADETGKVLLWDLETQKIIASDNFGSHIRALEFSPNGEWIAVGSHRRRDSQLQPRILLWDKRNESLELLSTRARLIHQIVFSTDGRLIAGCDVDGLVDVWDVSSRRLVKHLVPQIDSIDCLQFSRDGTTLAVAGRGIELWDIDSWKSKVMSRAPRRDNVVAGIRFSPDGERLAAGIQDGSVEIWDPISGRLSITLTTRGSPRQSQLVFRADGSLRTVSHGGHVYDWDFTPFRSQ